MNDYIDISPYDKAAVLAALYNHSRQQGLGFLDPKGRQLMTTEDAAKLLETQVSFDYLHGRVMKVHLHSNQFDPYLYDRDNGPGAAARAIATLTPSTSVA